MLFDFRSCAAQWLSHARGDARPLERGTAQQAPVPRARPVRQLLPPPRRAQPRRPRRGRTRGDLRRLRAGGDAPGVRARHPPAAGPDARQRSAPYPARAGPHAGAAGHPRPSLRRRARHGRGSLAARPAGRTVTDAVVRPPARRLLPRGRDLPPDARRRREYGYRKVNVARPAARPGFAGRLDDARDPGTAGMPRDGMGRVADPGRRRLPRTGAGDYRWRDGRGGHAAQPARLYRPTRADGPDGYRTVNVLDQPHHPGSLYSWVAHAIRVRARVPRTRLGPMAHAQAQRPARAGHRDPLARIPRMVTLHNLSAEAADHPVARRPRSNWRKEQIRVCLVLGYPDPPTAPARRLRSAVMVSAGCATRLNSRGGFCGVSSNQPS